MTCYSDVLARQGNGAGERLWKQSGPRARVGLDAPEPRKAAGWRAGAPRPPRDEELWVLLRELQL